MPARSNDFQRLVYLVKKLLADSATVTESKLLTHRTTGERREVDICIENITAGHDFMISIECRDHARRADVTWVEQMKAKHEHLPTKLLVLAARSGHTDQAKQLAGFEGFQLLPYESLTEEAARNTFAAWGPSLWGMTYRLMATRVTAVLKVVHGMTKPLGESNRVAVQPPHTSTGSTRRT